MRGQSETPGQGLQNWGRVLPPDPPWAQGRQSLGWEQGVLWAVGWEVAWSRYWLRVWGGFISCTWSPGDLDPSSLELRLQVRVC